MRVINVIIESGVIMNTNINSQPLNLNQMFGYSIQAVYTGTPTGTFKLQCSVDANSGNINPVNWTDIANTPFVVASAGSFTWNVYDVMYNWVRLVYTDASGGTSTAVLTATYNGKGM